MRNDHTEVHKGVQPIDKDKIVAQTTWAYQFGLLAKRNFLNLLRLPQTSYVKLLTTCMTALFAVLLFFDTPKDQQGIQNVQGSLFFITMNISFNAIQNVILIFPDERPVFLREVNNNMYDTTPYFWAKVISEMPFSIMVPAIFGCIVYYAIGYNPAFDNFMLFELILILMYNASSGYSLIISASFSDKQLAVTLTPVLIIPFMLFAGFFVSSDNIPWYLKEFEYLSIFKYGYWALMRNQFDEYYDEKADWESMGKPEPNDCTYSCMCENDGLTSCDPFSQIAMRPDLSGSMWCLFGIYALCYMVSWFILSRLSSSFE